jgi:metal-sulfur cluster biosynthetic enzyme
MLTEEDIREALRACFEVTLFERPVNVVDLGLVEAISLAPDPDAPGAGIPGVPPRQAITLTLIPASAQEDATGILLAQIHNRLAGLPELSRISIHLDREAVWTPERVAGEARQGLRLDPPVFAILNQRPVKA